jgi:outer membrane protein
MVGVSAIAQAQHPIAVKSATETELNQLPQPQATSLLPKLLTLDDAIILALRNNPSVHSSRLERINDKYALELANYAFQPHFDFSVGTTFTQGQKTGYNFNPGVTLNTRYGTQLGVTHSTNLQGNQQDNFTVTQPLLRGFGAVNQIPWLNAQDNETVARQTFKNSIMMIVTDVITNYRQVVQDENNLIVQQKTLAREEETAKEYELRVNAGKMAPSELVQEQATLANTRLSTMRQKNAAQQSYQILLDTLGLSPSSQLKLDTHIHFTDYHAPNQEQAIDIALNNNPQYISQKIALNAAKRAVLSAKDNLRWQLNLSGAVNFLSSPGSTSIINGYESLSTTNSPTATISLSIPIRDVTNKAELVRSKVSLAQAEDALEQSRRSLIRQVVNSLNNLNSQLEQLKLGEQAVDLRRKNLEAEQIKQKYGQATALNVSIIQDNLLQQETDLINSQIGYLNNVTAFQNLLGATLDDWHIEVRY